MLAGIFFIVMGVLIIIYPALLSMIVAAFLIIMGLSIFLTSIYFKRVSRRFNNPYMNFFIRF